MSKPKGFLLIDGEKNTIVVRLKDPEMDDLTDWLRPERLSLVKRHKTKSELDKDISLYLKAQYEQEDI